LEARQNDFSLEMARFGEYSSVFFENLEDNWH